MTPEAQRIAIAEACGWKWHGEATYGGTQRNGWWKDDNYSFHGIPDYPTDLNAMHEAEKVLTDEQYINYGKALVLAGMGQNRTDAEASRATLSATAAHRAETFLRILNLYTSL